MASRTHPGRWACRAAALLALVFAGACAAGGAGPSATASPPAKLEWRGVSLAGAEFGESELPGIYNKHYVYPDPSSATYFAGKGMNLVRLPFSWERLQRSLNGEFDATELARLKSFVTPVTAAGTTVLLDPHNYARYHGKLIGSSEVPVAAFADFWTRLAGEFKGNPKVMFGLMNEPHSMATEAWVTAANAAIAAIRATGAMNTITVPGNAWSGAGSWSDTWYGTPNAVAMLQVTDPADKLLIEVHQYLNEDSSGSQPTCVSPTIGSQRLAGFTQWLRVNHRRGLLGEIGGANNATCNQAVADALGYMTANADVWAGWVWWAAGPWWGDYFLSIEPGAGGVDKPQMAVLAPYL
jgi:endoglucanase